MSVNKDKYVPESGAEFQIIDPHGEVVDTLITDEKGEATSISLVDWCLYIASDQG